jgi:hypothetical protein
MVKDQEEKVQKPPDLPTICTKESTRSAAPTLVMTESIIGRFTAFCLADVRQLSKKHDLLQEAATNCKSRSFPNTPFGLCRSPGRFSEIRTILLVTCSITVSSTKSHTWLPVLAHLVSKRVLFDTQQFVTTTQGAEYEADSYGLFSRA